MLTVIDSPVHNTNYRSFNPPLTPHNRYSSCDDQNNYQNDFNRTTKYQRKTLQKQRVHSQKKLTLTTQNQQTSYNKQPTNNQQQAYNPQSMNSYLNFTKDQSLKKQGKITLQKKGKYCSLKSSQCNINLNEITTNNTKYNNQADDNHQNAYYKQRSKALLQNPKQNLNPAQNKNMNVNTYKNDKESSNAYTFAEISSTAPNSPVYANTQNILNTNRNEDIKKYVQQKLIKQATQTNQILFEQNMKIKQLQAKLIKNQECLRQKNCNIQQLKAQLKYSQISCFSQSQPNSPVYKNLESCSRYSRKQNALNENYSFILQKMSDMQKKCAILSKYVQESNSSINIKIDQLNNLLTNTLNHKFMAIKGSLLSFISKNQYKINSYSNTINLMTEKTQQLLKASNINMFISKIGVIKQQMTEAFKYQPKSQIFIDDMKNTINTVHTEENSDQSQRATQESIDTHSEFKQSSFWQNLQDISFGGKQQQVSFAEDCFFYPGGNNSATLEHKQFFTSLQSFSKLPQAKVTISTNSYNPFVKTTKNISTKANQSENNFISILPTIQQIAKSRRYPIACYIDQNGKLRYKGSQSYIFDKRGNTLKPEKNQLQTCIQNNWIILDDQHQSQV